MLEFILHKFESIIEELEKEYKKTSTPLRRRRGRRIYFEECVKATIEEQKHRIRQIIWVICLLAVLFFIRDKWMIVGAVILYTVVMHREFYVGHEKRPNFNHDGFQKYKKACEEFKGFLVTEFSIQEGEKLKSLIEMCEERIKSYHYIGDRNISAVFMGTAFLGSFIGYIADTTLLSEMGGLNIMGIIYMLFIVFSFGFGLYYLRHMMDKQMMVYRYEELQEVLVYLEKIGK